MQRDHQEIKLETDMSTMKMLQMCQNVNGNAKIIITALSIIRVIILAITSHFMIPSAY